jgi:hypothetical protein
MGRYKRVTDRQSWSTGNMSKAIEAIRSGEMGLKKASKVFNVPRTTLQRRCKTSEDIRMAAEKRLGSKSTVFTCAMEDELVSHMKTMESMLFGFTPKRLRQLAYQFAKVNGINDRFSDEKQEAGTEWYRGFMSRHPQLSLRMPEPTSAARAQGFNEVAVGKFFDLLQDLQQKLHFTPDRIYNCDETGITTVPNKPSKVIAAKGKKQVGSLSSAERGQLVTVEICMSASGNFVPPLFVFPRCRMKPDLMDNAPPGSQGVAHPSGWMQSDIFLKWFEHFVRQTHPSAETPVLLILDGHKTHTTNLDVINMAREQHVSILCLPPHCSHRLQPLDVSFMKPLNTFYAQEVERWLLNHPGRVVTVNQLPELFGAAYLRSASALTAVNGFMKTGIWPINRNVFSEADFAAALPTDMPVPHHPDESESVSLVIEDPDGTETSLLIPVVQSDDNALDAVPIDVIAGTSQCEVEHVATEENFTNQADDICHQTLRSVEEPQNHCPSADECGAQSVQEDSTVHVLEISPLPHATHRANRKSVRAKGKTALLTSSPYKQELMNKRQLAHNKEVEIEAKKARKLLAGKSSTAADGPTSETKTSKRNEMKEAKGEAKKSRKLAGKAKSSTAADGPTSETKTSKRNEMKEAKGEAKKSRKLAGKAKSSTAADGPTSETKTSKRNEMKEAKGEAKKSRKLAGKAKSSTAEDVSESEMRTSKRKEKMKKRKQSVEVACMGCGIKEHSAEDKKMACGWHACFVCHSWYHDPCAECAGIFDDDDSFTCKHCCS